MADWWSYPTNYSNGTAVTGVADFFVKYPSFILSDKLGIGITMIIWLMSFGLSMQGGARKAIMIASFISFLFSIYFVRLGVMNTTFTIILLIATIIGAIASKEESSSL
jgi:hypothetical protein